MKKKLLNLILAVVACFMLALFVGAEEGQSANGIYYSDTDAFGTVNIIEGYDYYSDLSLEQRIVLDNGDGTYSTYPSAYVLNYNNDKSKRGYRFQFFDPSMLNDETGYTYSHLSVIRCEIPEGITTIHHDDRNNINFNACENAVEVTLPSTLTTFTKASFFDGMDSLVRVDMSRCSSLTSIPGSTFANCPVIRDVTFGNALTGIADNAFYASGIENVAFPESVKSFGKQIFYNCKSLKSVTMYDGVTSLGTKMFQYSTLESFVVPAGVTSIPQDCFHGCTSLTSVTMGNNVTSMAGYIFNGCSSLTTVVLSDNITTINGYSFAGCSSLTEIVLPSALTAIPANLFSNCTVLARADIPSGVTSIGTQAFYKCNALKSVTLPDSLESIGKESFAYCSAITEVTIPKSVTSLNQYIFTNCTSLTTVTFEEGINIQAELVGLFKNCSALTSVNLPNGITGIGSDTFYGCSSLTAITGGLPITVANIGASAFRGCSTLTEIGAIPEGVTSIGANAFNGCTVLAEIILPSTITTLGQDCFNGCKAITSIALPNGLVTISGYVFKYCTSLVSINIPDTVTSLGKYAFDGCTALTTVTISENSSITGAMEGTFNNCSALTGFIIPRGITSIGQNTFKACKKMTTIGGPLPSGLTYIGMDAFKSCVLLTEIVLPNGLETIYNYAFTTCSGLISMVIPDSVTSLGTHAFYNCSALTSVTISENSQIQGSWTSVFRGCTSLTSIYIPAGVTTLVSDNFNGCKALTTVTISHGLTEITKSNNFASCTALKSIRFPNSLLSIADGNLGGCTALEEVRFGDSITHIGAGNLTLKALKRVYLPGTITSVGTHLLGYTNANDSSKNITFIFTGTYAQAQALRALVKEDSANAANASKLYDAKLVPASEYDVSTEPSGYTFVYNFSVCEAFYDSHDLVPHNACVDKCLVCLYLYAVQSPVHNFEGGEAIVYVDFAQSGKRTCVCQNEGCNANDGSSVSVPPIFSYLGYSIFEIGSSISVSYTVNVEALLEYERTNKVKLDYGLVGAYVGYLNGGTPLDPETTEPVDVSQWDKRIYCHSIRRYAQPNADLRLVNIQKAQYDEEFYLCLYIYDGKEVKYLTGDKSVSIPDTVSYADVRGPVETTVDGMTYSTEKETTPNSHTVSQMAESAAVYNTTTMSDSDARSIINKANTVITGGSLIGWSNAADLLQHFLDGSGEQYTLNMTDFLKDSNNKSYRNTEINRALRAAEQLAREGEYLTMNQLWENKYTPKDDWYYAMGTYYCDVDMMNLTVTVDENGIKHYSADIKYSATDFYNWNKNDTTPVINKKVLFVTITGPSPAELYRLHEAGRAQEFTTYGEITYKNVTWTEGQTVDDLGI